MLGAATLQTLGPRYHCIGLSGKSRPAASMASDWVHTDINDASRLKTAVYRAKPDVIVHMASSVAVNDCEKPEAREPIRRLHVGVSADLAEVARELRAQLIYISTESVFDGRKAGLYTEADPVNPLNYYARTKHEGELAALQHERTLILRTNIFGWRTDGALSFGEWVLEGLRKQERRTMFTDVLFSPLSTYLAADTIGRCIERELTGLFHAGGADTLSKFDFAIRMANRLKLSTESLIPCRIDSVQMGAPRPKNTGIDSSKLAAALGQPSPTLDQSIETWLRRGI